MKTAQFLLFVLVAAIPLTGIFARGDCWARVPEVTVVGHSPGLAYAMYPEFYRAIDDAAADTTYRSAAIIEGEVYWAKYGNRLLAVVSELSGLPWKEKAFTLYFAEETPSWGVADPFIYPLQYWRRGDLVRMAPVGDARAFVLAHLLAQRIFLQIPDAKQPEVLQHPLFQMGIGTRDVLANLVAYWTVAEIFGEAKAAEFAQDPAFTLESPGIRLMVGKLLPGWRLTAKKPLVEWVKQEPRDSDLVKAALGFRESLGVPPTEGRRPGTPDRAYIGLRPRVTADGDVVVWAIEPGKLAEKADLHPGDVFLRVGGVSVSDSRDVMLRLVAVMKNQGTVQMEVDRDGHVIDAYMNRAWLKKGS